MWLLLLKNGPSLRWYNVQQINLQWIHQKLNKPPIKIKYFQRDPAHKTGFLNKKEFS